MQKQKNEWDILVKHHRNIPLFRQVIRLLSDIDQYLYSLNLDSSPNIQSLFELKLDISAEICLVC